MVRTVMEYSDPHLRKDIDSLEMVQRHAAHIEGNEVMFQEIQSQKKTITSAVTTHALHENKCMV